jgi:hypothetical protein
MGVVGLVALVLVAYPKRADSSVLQAYGSLQRSPVPVQVVGWIKPTDAHAQLVAGGYVLTVQAAGVGEVTISGNRDLAALPADGMRWQSADTGYALQTSADQSLISSRITSLQIATDQLTGSTLDSPLLYVVYLPALVAFGGRVAVSLLRRP